MKSTTYRQKFGEKKFFDIDGDGGPVCPDTGEQRAEYFELISVRDKIVAPKKTTKVEKKK